MIYTFDVYVWLLIILQLANFIPGCRDMYLYIRNSAADPRWYDFGSQSRWNTRCSMQSQRGATTYTRKEMVHGTNCDHYARRYSSLRIDLHWDVFHLHVLLGLQNLLRLRFHVTGICNPDDRHGMRNHCVHVLPSECGRLQMVSILLFILFYVAYKSSMTD